MRHPTRLLTAAVMAVGVVLFPIGPAAAQPTADPASGAPPSTGGVPTTATAGPQPPPTGQPAPTTTTNAPPPGPPAGPGGPITLPGLPRLIGEAIDQWLQRTVVGLLDPALDLVGRTLLATPDLAAPGGRVQELWSLSRVLATTSYVLLVVLGGMLLMAHETLQTRFAVKDIAPRLVVGAVASNLSLHVVRLGMDLANALTRALLGAGVDEKQALAALRGVFIVRVGDADMLVLLVAVVGAVLAVLLAATYVLRVSLLTLLAVGAPLALALHALPQTEEVAQLWWRSLGACLGAQVGQALTLIAAVRVFFDPAPGGVLGVNPSSLVNLLVGVCLLWLLVRIPFWALRVAMQGRPSMVAGAARSYVVYRLLRRGMRRLPV
jgi:hypothetical protein